MGDKLDMTHENTEKTLKILLILQDLVALAAYPLLILNLYGSAEKWFTIPVLWPMLADNAGNAGFN